MKIDQKENLCNTMRTGFMASAKQIAWRKKFARMSKSWKVQKEKRRKVKKSKFADKSLTAICGIVKNINKSKYYQHTGTHFN